MIPPDLTLTMSTSSAITSSPVKTKHKIPVVIWHLIFEHLLYVDLRNFDLTCRHFAELTSLTLPHYNLVKIANQYHYSLVQSPKKNFAHASEIIMRLQNLVLDIKILAGLKKGMPSKMLGYSGSSLVENTIPEEFQTVTFFKAFPLRLSNPPLRHERDALLALRIAFEIDAAENCMKIDAEYCKQLHSMQNVFLKRLDKSRRNSILKLFKETRIQTCYHLESCHEPLKWNSCFVWLVDGFKSIDINLHENPENYYRPRYRQVWRDIPAKVHRGEVIKEATSKWVTVTVVEPVTYFFPFRKKQGTFQKILAIVDKLSLLLSDFNQDPRDDASKELRVLKEDVHAPNYFECNDLINSMLSPAEQYRGFFV